MYIMKYFVKMKFVVEVMMAKKRILVLDKDDGSRIHRKEKQAASKQVLLSMLKLVYSRFTYSHSRLGKLLTKKCVLICLISKLSYPNCYCSLKIILHSSK